MTTSRYAFESSFKTMTAYVAGHCRSDRQTCPPVRVYTQHNTAIILFSIGATEVITILQYYFVLKSDFSILTVSIILRIEIPTYQLYCGVFCTTANMRTSQRTVYLIQRFAVSQKNRTEAITISAFSLSLLYSAKNREFSTLRCKSRRHPTEIEYRLFCCPILLGRCRFCSFLK